MERINILSAWDKYRHDPGMSYCIRLMAARGANEYAQELVQGMPLSPRTLNRIHNKLFNLGPKSKGVPLPAVRIFHTIP